MSTKPASADLGPDLPGLTCRELIGHGGYADVYLYEQAQPRMQVAVKLLRLGAVDDNERRLFAAEADTMAELAEHPYIVPVLGAGTAPDGRPYLVMRYYPSSDVGTRAASKPLTAAEALRLGIQLASAVETAHRARIIHRDIKPANILISSYGQPGLSDFGIAGRPSDTGDLADSDDLGVSIPWSPPEVLSGRSNGSVTSDVYSLAATVWHLLVGRPPFFIPGADGDNSERATVTRIVHSRPPATGRDDVPASLDRLLQQAMAKDPAHRPQSALELARHFQRVEQELRLARTEIVVLEQQNAALLEDRGTTKVADNPVTGEGVAVGSLSRPAARGDVAGETLAGPTSRPTTSSPPASPSHEALTERKTPRRVESPQVRRAPHSSAADLPTQFKPRVTPSAQAPAVHDTTPPTPRGRRWLIVATAGLAVVAMIAAALFSSRGHVPQATRGVRHQPVDTSIGDVAPVSLSNPRVRAEVNGSRVVFSWQKVAGATGYVWKSSTGRQGRTANDKVAIPKATSGKTCIVVQSTAPEAGLSDSSGAHACR